MSRYIDKIYIKTSISQSSVFHRLEIITLSRHNLYPSTCHLSCTVQCREGGRGEERMIMKNSKSCECLVSSVSGSRVEV